LEPEIDNVCKELARKVLAGVKSRRDLLEFAGVWRDFDAEPLVKERRAKFDKDATLLP
jgi:hypothetical protein